MRIYYEKTEELNELKQLEHPTVGHLQCVKNIIGDDTELTQYFYDKNEKGALRARWLELLDGAGQFASIGKKEAGTLERIKALYLADCAKDKSAAVLEIIKKTKAKDAWIQGKMLNAILTMPEDLVVQSIPVVQEYLEGKEYKIWHFVGEPAAQLMVRLIENHPKEAFEIAGLLLDVWRPEEKEAGVFERIRSKFAAHEYKELMFNFYSKVWERRPFEAIGILVEIYDKYLEECKREKGYDVSEYLGLGLRDLEDTQQLDRDFETIVVKALCEGGQAAIQKEREKIGKLLDDLEKRDKGVFYRVEMHLLRFVPAGMEKDRINKLIGNQKFIESPFYKYEHRHLLNNKFDDVTEEIKKKFVEWVKQEKITEKKKKEVKEWCLKNNDKLPDFEKWEYQEKGKELYLVRDRFKNLYEEYKSKSGLNDAALAPRRMISEARSVSPTEGSPVESDEMAKMKADNVLDYILEPTNYQGKKKAGQWHDPAEALTATFKWDVKKRPLEYLSVSMEKLERLDPEFLANLFYGVWEAIKADFVGSEGWKAILKLAEIVVGDKRADVRYRECFNGILWTLREGFREESNGIKFNEETIKTFWSILAILAEYKSDNGGDSKEDPVQLRCRSVVGEAVELSVSLGIVCKNQLKELYDGYLRTEIRRCYDRTLSNIREPGVSCTFGLDFARVYWTDSEWVENNLDKIFCNELWDETWGTYMSWGRPSPECFKVLLEKGKYGQAVEMLGKAHQYKYQFAKKPNEGLVEHLMIGFFNGWVGFEDKVLRLFFDKASTELRAKAASFLTTGFKTVNEEDGAEKGKIAERMREYWNKRLEAIKSSPKENEEEAIELTGWVEHSVLPAKETLELLEQSLELSGGKIGKMRDARDFIEGISNLGKGNELLALRCLKKAAADENMHMPWSDIQKPLVSFLEAIVDLPEDIRNVGIEVADLYGRYNPDKFRGVWEKLRNQTAK